MRLAAEARGLAGEVAVRDCAIGQLRRSHATVVAAKDAELARQRSQVRTAAAGTEHSAARGIKGGKPGRAFSRRAQIGKGFAERECLLQWVATGRAHAPAHGSNRAEESR